MTIGVDAGALSIDDDRLKVGVYRVTKHALASLAVIDRKNLYRLYTFTAIEEGIASGFKDRAEVRQLPKRGWQRVWLPLELMKRPVDVFLGIAQSLPHSKTSYNMGFVYDLGFLYHPEAYGASAKTLNNQTDKLVQRADHIITISHATKSDLIREYGLPKEKITVAYPGVDAAFSPGGEKFVGSNPYFLFVGSLTKTKDIPTLLHAFKAGKTSQPYDLYLIGGDYWPDPAIEEAIKTLHLEDRVKKIGFVTDTDLPKYYRGALAFVTAALHEGFCLPAAESMACGTPVVALDRGALKEIVGEGGIIVRKTETFAEAMVKMTNKTIRQAFAKNAIVQSKKFRWEVFAKQIFNNMP